MKFELVDRQGYIPELTYGTGGSEMSAFVPNHYDFKQMDFDNGIGKVSIDNHVWHFYFTGEGIGVELVDGIVTLNEANRFLATIKEHIWGTKHEEVQMMIAGERPH
ncbi:hypothetical protein [Marinomonas balearica]|uniref:Uncharacterized protein n=1 Tax=Marinomonas balearica TaxID=491947 RepID=A0A4R6M836_9GAMM|nr:hypothetical protein [Marinomonas balearica]TDO96309.1 hypothetical protein DFP79_2882 [Marinomonas balearica]